MLLARLAALPLLLSQQRVLQTQQRVCPQPALLASDDAADDVLQLVLQRAVQTCCFTSRQCRNPPTAQWLAEYAQDGQDGPEAFERVHACGCLNVPWREYLLSMLDSAPIEIVVQSVLKKHRGVSANNPYLQTERMSFAYELRPADIAERVMLAARQIASEWSEDLSRMSEQNAEVWTQRRAAVTQDDEELRTTLPAFSNEGNDDDGSPYRGGNYDLLLVLATRRAARYALSEYASLPSKQGELTMLRDHCERLPPMGVELPYHSADTWLRELLDLPIVLKLGGGEGGEGGRIIDPRAVVELVLDCRLAVAKEWTATLLDVPELHRAVKLEHVMSHTRGIG